MQDEAADPLAEIANMADEVLPVTYLNVPIAREKKDLIEALADEMGITATRFVSRLIDRKLAEVETWRKR